MKEKTTKPYTITAGDFRALIWEHFKDLPVDAEIAFGNGDLMFYRPKHRGDVLHIEFNQAYRVELDPDADD